MSQTHENNWIVEGSSRKCLRESFEFCDKNSVDK